MNMRMVLLAIVAILIAGCSTPETRSKEKQTAFDRLGTGQQTAVLGGKVERGMSADAVYIAFGPPDRISKVRGAEEWIYTKPEFYDIPHWGDRSVQRADGRMAAIPEYDPLQMKRYVDKLKVIFKNGKVTDWKNLSK